MRKTKEICYSSCKNSECTNKSIKKFDLPLQNVILSKSTIAPKDIMKLLLIWISSGSFQVHLDELFVYKIIQHSNQYKRHWINTLTTTENFHSMMCWF